MSEIRCKILVTALRYGTPDGNFSVYSGSPYGADALGKLPAVDFRNNISITGDFYLENYPQVYDMTLELDTSSSYQGSYKLKKIHYGIPKDANTQWVYLKGVKAFNTKQYASLERAHKKNENIIDIILDPKSRIDEIKGIGKKSLAKARKKLQTEVEKGIFYTEFSKVDGVADSTINKIMKISEDIMFTLNNIKKNPFWLLSYDGFGFMIADAFRKAVGIPEDDMNRVLHGIKYSLELQLEGSGDTYSTIEDAISSSAKRLALSPTVVMNKLNYAVKENIFERYGLVAFGNSLTTIELHKAEQRIYNFVKKSGKNPLVEESFWIQEIENYELSTGSTFTDEQKDALIMANREELSLLIGQGGSGKSWITKVLCDLLEQSGVEISLLAPTGRAAKILSGYTGRKASTIHLGIYDYSFGSSSRIKELSSSMIIVDEASMCDSVLASDVMAASKFGAHILFIGDDFQLPSVAPGNVLYDFINYMDVPKVKLTQIFRQAEESGIYEVCTQLRNGTFKVSENNSFNTFGTHEDFIHENINDVLNIKNRFYDVYKGLLKSGIKKEDVMNLTPVNAGELGREGLNKGIQELVNSPNQRKPRITFGKALSEKDQKHYLLDDMVVVQKNNYQAQLSDYAGTRAIVNGDNGVITDVNVFDNEVFVSIGDSEFVFTKEEFNEYIQLGYALTVHKAQGGQAPYVLAVIPNNAYYLNANLIYTLISRAQTAVYLIGSAKVLNSAAKKFENFDRKTMLKLMSKTKDA